MLMLHKKSENLHNLVGLVIQPFQALGLIINGEKSTLVPTQSLKFLGVTIKYVPMQI